MRIISKFKDFYDCGMAWGQDPSLIYLRLPQVLEGASIISTYPSVRGTLRHIIGFCGKIYPCLRMPCTKTVEEYVDGRLKEQNLFEEIPCFNIEDVDRFVDKVYTEKQRDYYYEQRKKKKSFRFPIYSFYSRDEIPRRDECLEFFDFIEERKEKFYNFFIDKKTPIFVQYPQTRWDNKVSIVINEELGKFNFAKVFDPVRAYQEISMFVGGIASPEKEIPDVSDEDLLEAKGFDNWSFRKMSSKN